MADVTAGDPRYKSCRIRGFQIKKLWWNSTGRRMGEYASLSRSIQPAPFAGAAGAQNHPSVKKETTRLSGNLSNISNFSKAVDEAVKKTNTKLKVQFASDCKLELALRQVALR
jgi:hypothetical protein